MPSSIPWFAMSLSLWCLLNEQKFLILMESNLLVFSLWLVLFVSCFKTFPTHRSSRYSPMVYYLLKALLTLKDVWLWVKYTLHDLILTIPNQFLFFVHFLLFSVLNFYFSATVTKSQVPTSLLGENGHIDRSSARLDFTGLQLTVLPFFLLWASIL